MVYIDLRIDFPKRFRREFHTSASLYLKDFRPYDLVLVFGKTNVLLYLISIV